MENRASACFQGTTELNWRINRLIRKTNFKPFFRLKRDVYVRAFTNWNKPNLIITMQEAN